jgi:hypothetical protein
MIPVVFRGLPHSLEVSICIAYLVSGDRIILSSLPKVTIFCHRWKLHKFYSYTASLDSLRVVDFCPSGWCSHLFLPWFRISEAVHTADDEMVSATVYWTAMVGGGQPSELLLLSAIGGTIVKHWKHQAIRVAHSERGYMHMRRYPIPCREHLLVCG